MAYAMKPPHIIRTITVIVLTVLIAALSVLAVVNYEASPGPIQPASCLRDHCFCEAPSLTGLVEPVDSITSLAFVVAGALALFAWFRFSNKTREKTLVLAFAITFAFIGASSFFYHGTLSYLGQFLDVFSMYIFAILLLCAALVRRGAVRLSYVIVLFIVLNISFGLLQYYFPDARRIVFGLLLIPGLLLEQQPRTTGHAWFSKPTRPFYIGVGCLTIGYVFWFLDQSNLFCFHQSIIQGHAIWHIFTAIGAYMVIIHYRNTSHKIRKAT
jgi:hypothetical protein